MQGRKGVGLNETGVEQVRALAAEIEAKKLNFDICFSSPLARAVESAEILVGGKCEIVYDERLVERGFGEFEGKSKSEFWNVVGENDILDRVLNYSEYGIEPIKEMLERARSFLNDIKSIYGDKTVLVVAHSMLLRVLHFEIVGYDDKTDFYDFHMKNAEMKYYVV